MEKITKKRNYLKFCNYLYVSTVSFSWYLFLAIYFQNQN